MLNQLTASDFDTLFLPGGHGPMWDLSADIDIKQLVKDCYSDYKIISTVCHGPAGLLQAIDQNGNSILKNKKVTGFTNDEENSVGLTKVVPFLLEDRMKELGSKFERGQDFKQFVVSDGRLITGQNQVCISCYRKSGRSSWKAIKPFGCLRILTESKRIIL